MSPYTIPVNSNVAPVSEPLVNPNLLPYSSCLYSNGTMFQGAYQDACSSSSLANILPSKNVNMLETTQNHLLTVNSLSQFASSATVL